MGRKIGRPRVLNDEQMARARRRYAQVWTLKEVRDERLIRNRLFGPTALPCQRSGDTEDQHSGALARQGKVGPTRDGLKLEAEETGRDDENESDDRPHHYRHRS